MTANEAATTSRRAEPCLQNSYRSSFASTRNKMITIVRRVMSTIYSTYLLS